MTQEQKELLIKDLCARLPYGVQVQDTRCGISGKLHDMLAFQLYKGDDVYDYIATTNFYTDCYYDDIELFKPYLFPMSSMTDEEYEKFIMISGWAGDIDDIKRGKLSCIGYVELDDIYDAIDWFNKNHFDYRGLIEKGLAIDATDKNIY